MTFEVWQRMAADRYSEIRALQARKIVGLQEILGKNGFHDIEGSLVAADRLDSQDSESTHYREKCLNYVYACKYLQPRSLLEIGFNWGYSASLLLEAVESASLVSIDIAQHWYTRPCGDFLQQIYKHRLSTVWSDSHAALAEQVAAGATYDFAIVDGGHAFRTAEKDIQFCKQLLNPGGILVVDDSDGPNVRAAILATMSGDANYLELTPENFGLFPYEWRGQVCFEQKWYLKKS
jgi:predicted O-methyltransferase YrrM